jgi:hypothetical protein
MAAEGEIWTVRHGDLERSRPWAILEGDATPFDLTGWTVHAQLRATAVDDVIIYEWTRAHGVTVTTALVQLADATEVTTAAVQLFLEPADYAVLTRAQPSWTGSFDVEIASDATTAPVRRYTIVADAKLVILGDITHD